MSRVVGSWLVQLALVVLITWGCGDGDGERIDSTGLDVGTSASASEGASASGSTSTEDGSPGESAVEDTSQDESDSAVSPDIQIAPRLAFAGGVDPAQPVGPLFPIVVELIDPNDALADEDFQIDVRQSAGSAMLDASSTTFAPLVNGVATFENLVVSTSGDLVLEFIATGGTTGAYETTPLRSSRIVLASQVDYRPVFLDRGRVGVGYRDALPRLDGTASLVTDLPPGLAFDPGMRELFGTPASAGLFELDIVVENAGQVTWLAAELPVVDGSAFVAVDEPPALPGSFSTNDLTLQIPSVMASGGPYYNVNVLVTFPVAADGGTELPPGRFPLISFHHAAHIPAEIYQFYRELHTHWASHGFIVTSVDADATVSLDGVMQIKLSWTNLVDMSAFQQAAIDLLALEHTEPSSPFYRHVDLRRVVASGHSRGGGASLLTMERDHRLLAGIGFEPVNPTAAPGQNYSTPGQHWNQPLLRRANLVFVAQRDRDVFWPIVDPIYDQRTGPTAMVLIHEANHEYTYDANTPGEPTGAAMIPIAERHDIDQHYSTTFLRRFAHREWSYDQFLFSQGALSTDINEEGVTVRHDPRMNTRIVIDDFQDTMTATNLLGGAMVAESLAENTDEAIYEDAFNEIGVMDARTAAIAEWSRARKLTWLGNGQLRMVLGGLDVTGRTSLRFEVMRPCPPAPGDRSQPDDTCPAQDVSFLVGLSDQNGGSGTIEVDAGMGINGVVGRHFATVNLPFSEFPDVDPSNLAEISLVFESVITPNGSIYIDNVTIE